MAHRAKHRRVEEERPRWHQLGGGCRGTAMLTVLMMMFALFFLSSIMMDASSNYLNLWVAPHVRTAQALYVAEGGAHLALQWLRDAYGLPNNTYFTTNEGQILYNSQIVVLSRCDSCTDSTLPTNHPDPYTDTKGTVRSEVVSGFRSNLTIKSLGNGTFNVQATLLGIAPQQWRIVSTGAVSGVSKTVTMQVRRNPFNPPFALVTGGDLTIGGNSKIEGTAGNAHSNGNLSVGNSISVAGVATSTGTCSGCDGHPGWGGGRPKVDIPEVIPSEFRQYATYELRSDGNVYCGQAGASVGCTPGAQITSGPVRDQWSYSPSTEKWMLSDNTAADGAFYVEGHVQVAGSPGSNPTPWQVSLIATGDIEVSGSPVMKQYTQNLLLVAGDDLKISGNPNTDPVGGVMAAKNQLTITGTPQLNGFVFSQSATIASITTGNPTITYNGQLGNNPFLEPLAIVSWMES